MRRQLTFLFLAAFAALAVVGTAAAGGGDYGFAPQPAHSPNAHKITTTYWLIFVFTAVIFVLVEGLLVAFVIKYRSRGRGREVEGAQVHGHTRLELMWTAIPVVVLAVVAAFVFYQLPDIANAPAAADPVHITIEGHQYYWQYDYPNGARSIGTLHVPEGEVVDLKVVSPDVIHSWWIPSLGGKIQAIPGRTNHTWFQADPGTYDGQCAQLCGVFHASMLASVVSESKADYETYITKTAPATIGQQIWTGVCATCHGNLGQGGYGPAIANNTLLIQPSALAGIVHNGFTGSQGAMPPVGDTWTEAEFKSLASYVKHHIYKAAPLGG